jgi:hypothetical protein
MTDVRDHPYGDSCSLFQGYIVNGRRTFMTTRWLPSLDRHAAAVLIDQMARQPSTLCSVVTHNLRGAAARVGADATAFGVRQPHTMIEILAQVEAGGGDGSKKRAWAIETAAALEGFCLLGGYANILAGDDPQRSRRSFGPNADRLISAKRQYGPANLFPQRFHFRRARSIGFSCRNKLAQVLNSPAVKEPVRAPMIDKALGTPSGHVYPGSRGETQLRHGSADRRRTIFLLSAFRPDERGSVRSIHAACIMVACDADCRASSTESAVRQCWCGLP